MRNFFVALGFAILAGTVIADNHQQSSAEDWYKKDYAPLWEEKPWDNIEAIAGHYADVFIAHSADGSIDTVNSLESMTSSINGWKEEMWLSSELTTLETDLINPTTAAFKAKWRDVYTDGSDEFSCGWYLADLDGSKWSFTVFADLDCEAHGL